MISLLHQLGIWGVKKILGKQYNPNSSFHFCLCLFLTSTKTHGRWSRRLKSSVRDDGGHLGLSGPSVLCADCLPTAVLPMEASSFPFLHFQHFLWVFLNRDLFFKVLYFLLLSINEWTNDRRAFLSKDASYVPPILTCQASYPIFIWLGGFAKI